MDAVVDATNGPVGSIEDTVAWFGGTTTNLLAAEARAGVRHHVLLSIVGVDRVQGNPHYSGKREQERLIQAGPVPWTIVPATQFHDFAATVVGWTAQDGVAPIAPLLLQPIAPGDVAAVLAMVAAGEPRGRFADVAGPGPQDMVDMARRTLEARGETLEAGADVGRRDLRRRDGREHADARGRARTSRRRRSRLGWRRSGRLRGFRAADFRLRGFRAGAA